MSGIEYEYSQPLTFGGATSSPGPNFSLKSPFPQESECAILSVSFGAAGFAFVSPQSGPPAITLTSALAGQPGIVFQGSANNLTALPDAIFWKLDAEQTVYLTVAGTSSSSVLVTVKFRRLRQQAQQMAYPSEADANAMDRQEATSMVEYLAREAANERRGYTRGNR